MRISLFILFLFSTFYVCCQTNEELIASAKRKIEEGKVIAAIQDIEKVLKTEKDNEEALRLEEICAGEIKKHATAIEEYTELIKQNPESENLYLGRAYAYVAYGKYWKAIDDFNKALELKPNDDIAHFNRGNAYEELGLFTQAVKDYSAAININDTVVDYYYNRAFVFEEMGRLDWALTDYEKVIELAPNDVETIMDMAIDQFATHHFDAGCKTLEHAIDLNVEEANILYEKYCLEPTKNKHKKK